LSETSRLVLEPIQVYRSYFIRSRNGWDLKLTIQLAYSVELRSEWICTSNFSIMSCTFTFTGLSAWNSFLLRKLAVAQRVPKKKRGPVLIQIPAFVSAHKTATCARPHLPHTPVRSILPCTCTPSYSSLFLPFGFFFLTKDKKLVTLLCYQTFTALLTIPVCSLCFSRNKL